MKKFLYTLSLIALAISMVPACGEKPGQGNNDPTNSTTDNPNGPTNPQDPNKKNNNPNPNGPSNPTNPPNDPNDPNSGPIPETCGDGKVDVDKGEVCDNGKEQNKGQYNGCRVNCTLAVRCGDGIVNPNFGEQCDDGNTDGSDGCSADCKLENGYICREPGKPCVLDTCGDGIVQVGELCDDGNKVSGDGCSSTCDEVERGYDCPVPGEACVARQCGDSILIPGVEECDDGNGIDGDGCNHFCEIEPGYHCPNGPGNACVKTVCGDGKIEGFETCDDGNDASGDGCSSDCKIEIGYKCPQPGQKCVKATCGDGVIEGAEVCDDGNDVSGDGCDSHCQLEEGYHCPDGPGKLCKVAKCGNGIVEGLEQCDDGNLNAGDGCSPDCKEEDIFRCKNGVCRATCGDGITLYPYEECDDGNLTAGDGCSPRCTIEHGFTCTDFSVPNPPEIKVPMTIRDFRPHDQPNGHTDFERGPAAILTCKNADMSALRNLLNPNLGPNGKPELTPGVDCFGRISIFKPKSHERAKEYFNMFYLDTPEYNRTIKHYLPLTQDKSLDSSGQTYTYNDDEFFPINGKGWDVGKKPTDKNYHFTTEFRAYFRYRGGEVLTFKGDDDIWVFINGKLAIDLGGVHKELEESVTLGKDIDAKTGLKYDPNFELYEGGIYEIAIFHAERKVYESHYRLTLAGFLNAGTAVCESICGDGIIAGNEQCDDGNANDNDGCSSSCKIEPGYNCTGQPSTCVKPPCGDGKVQFPEQCDDGNTTNGDGCDEFCKLESCGNGVVDIYEECDDGNDIDTDACTNSCKFAKCGDLIVGPGEECDDGNNIDTDACTNQCKIATCGDGVVGPGEVCDDGVNDGSYGSCTFDCQAKSAYCGDGIVQKEAGEVCDDTINDGTYGSCSTDCKKFAPRCGDGKKDEDDGEKCDDGNEDYGDGCDGVCRIEPGYHCTEDEKGKSHCVAFG